MKCLIQKRLLFAALRNRKHLKAEGAGTPAMVQELVVSNARFGTVSVNRVVPGPALFCDI
jgi:hypothetical protein